MNEGGSVTVALTPVAVCGPPLEIDTVKVTVCPLDTGSEPSVSETARSAPVAGGVPSARRPEPN